MSHHPDKTMSPSACQELLSTADSGVLAMLDNDAPYAIPVSYAWIDGRVVIHCAPQGHKLDCLARQPKVCLVVSRHPDAIQPHHPEGRCHYRYQSVQLFGQAALIAAGSERFDWLERFRQYFYRRLGLPLESDPLTPKAAENCACIVITPERISGRQVLK